MGLTVENNISFFFIIRFALDGKFSVKISILLIFPSNSKFSSLNFSISSELFKNSLDLVNTVKSISIDNLLVETDSPYLSPVPFRGKPNEPSYIKHTVKKISEIKNLEENVIQDATTKNFINLFNLEINEL